MKLFAVILCMAVTLMGTSAQFVNLYYQGQPTRLQYGICAPFLNSAGATPEQVEVQASSMCYYFQDDMCQTMNQSVPPLMVYPVVVANALLKPNPYPVQANPSLDPPGCQGGAAAVSKLPGDILLYYNNQQEPDRVPFSHCIPFTKANQLVHHAKFSKPVVCSSYADKACKDLRHANIYHLTPNVDMLPNLMGVTTGSFDCEEYRKSTG
ncbi:unnamed protein product [Absidia cylindrospora]